MNKNIKNISSFTALITLIGFLSGIFYKWDDISKFVYRTNYLYQHAETIEHLINDSHEVLAVRARVDVLEGLLKKERSRADSLNSLLILIERGKFPLDSILLKSKSGHYYKTTISDYLTGE